MPRASPSLSPPFIVRRHSSLYQSSVNQQPWQRRPHDIDGPEDETETDGKEISGLLHTTKCHGEYGSISSWHFVVCCKTDIALPFTSVSSTWWLILKGLFCYGCYLFSIIYGIANVCIQLRSSVFHWELAATSYSVPFTKFAINLLSQEDIPLLNLTARVAFSQSGSTISLP